MIAAFVLPHDSCQASSRSGWSTWPSWVPGRGDPARLVGFGRRKLTDAPLGPADVEQAGGLPGAGAAPEPDIRMIVVLWFLAAGVFAILNLRYSGRLAFSVAATVAIGGVTGVRCPTCWSSRMLRGAAARVMSGRPPRLAPRW
ncbi:hypothetical protein HBB16_19130 [Pseudonocardia sp. MCCB 268]|nr:hypothetical protein [Pseudonocardia cytotoxica]